MICTGVAPAVVGGAAVFYLRNSIMVGEEILGEGFYGGRWGRYAVFGFPEAAVK